MWIDGYGHGPVGGKLIYSLRKRQINTSARADPQYIPSDLVMLLPSSLQVAGYATDQILSVFGEFLQLGGPIYLPKLSVHLLNKSAQIYG